jgi:hypothetical protein
MFCALVEHACSSPLSFPVSFSETFERPQAALWRD